MFSPSVTGTFLNTLKFNVKDCDPTTGEPDDDEGPGYEDEYVVSVYTCLCVCMGGGGGECTVCVCIFVSLFVSVCMCVCVCVCVCV